MAMRGFSLLPSAVTKTLVCVDEFLDEDMRGTVYNPYMPEPFKFKSVYEAINRMERFFDDISFPHAHCSERTFVKAAADQAKRTKAKSEVHQYMSDEIFNNEKGKKATFVVQVQFRQNATWQGTISWTEKQTTQHFRSVLEMIKLMDGALSAGETE